MPVDENIPRPLSKFSVETGVVGDHDVRGRSKMYQRCRVDLLAGDHFIGNACQLDNLWRDVADG